MPALPKKNRDSTASRILVENKKYFQRKIERVVCSHKHMYHTFTHTYSCNIARWWHVENPQLGYTSIVTCKCIEFLRVTRRGITNAVSLLPRSRGATTRDLWACAVRNCCVPRDALSLRLNRSEISGYHASKVLYHPSLTSPRARPHVNVKAPINLPL